MTNKVNPIPIERMKESLSYCPDSGDFKRNNSKSSRMVGYISKRGYRVISIDQVDYYAHRLAWVFVYGEISTDVVVDHINGIKSDNRISNLRTGSQRQNVQNMTRAMKHSTTGLLGVGIDKRNRKKKFKMQIKDKGRMVTKLFYNAEEAHEYYKKLKREMHDFCTI